MSFSKPVWAIRAGWVMLAFLAAAGRLWAQPPISTEYQIKAVFLFNFAQFVTWPAEVFTAPDQPFRIGILGEDPFGNFMDQTVQGEKVNGHPLVIERYTSADDARDCQILFVSHSGTIPLRDILERLRGVSVLTVGDGEGFIRGGGIIRFFTENNKIHLKVNLEAAKRANLSISSKMLRLAQIVEVQRD